MTFNDFAMLYSEACAAVHVSVNNTVLSADLLGGRVEGGLGLQHSISNMPYTRLES